MTEPNTEAKSFTFKAETKQLLNILIHSLYKDREVFLREMLSNASDALNRIRFEMLTDRNVLDPDAELRIRITPDKEAATLTIQDTGIGMTRDEIIENLGTIAQSGARNFIEASKDKNVDLTQVIGQFGVGFYSVFMVADWVRVTSRSYKPEAEAVSWYATGEDNFEISPTEMSERGTKVEIKLKDDAKEFAEEYRLKNIIHKHSDYIGFPIYVGDDEKQVNKQTSLWRTSKSEITEEQYKDFYRQVTLDFEDPLTHIHTITDAPVQLYALLYIPSKGERGVFSLRKEDGLKLYSRNILIDEYNKDLLPEYLRFVQGVVDSEDLPLNVSRETVQTVGLMPRLKKVVTGQVMKELENLAKNDKEKFETFWQEFGVYLKQGIAANPVDAESIQSLLRFKTNQQPESWSSLEDYTGRMKDGQKEIYYIVGEDPKSVLLSPHLDYFQSQGTEVLLLTDPMDKYAMLVLCGRQKGLVCSLTRLIHFGLLPNELKEKSESVAYIDAKMISSTRTGKTVSEVFRITKDAYAKVGFADEWQLHHQGGPAGYDPREFLAKDNAEIPIGIGQAYAWNPSITGCKSEDTILVKESGNEILSVIDGWPSFTIQIDGQSIERPQILVIE